MAKRKTKDKEPSRFDSAAYVEFVDTLFDGPRSLVAGLLLQISLMAVFILETGQTIFSVFIVASVLGAMWRLHTAMGYKAALARAGELSEPAAVSLANKWERKFVFPSTFVAATIGFFAFFGLQGNPSAFAITAVMAMLFAPLPTIVGRIYGSRRLASFMLFGQFAPVFFGYLVSNSVSNIFLALLCLPYIALVLGMVDNVRATVVRAVAGNAEKVELGRQFDIALSNMSHGLMMFDDHARIQVINNQARKLFDIAEDARVSGRRLSTLLRYARRKGHLPQETLQRLSDSIGLLLSRQEDRQQVCIDGARFLDLTISERTKGGVVMTIEDSTERVTSARKIEHMARFDGLTGLANRQYFELEVGRYLQREPDAHSALIVVDVDDFKHVNDAIGHAQGDALLRSVARQLQSENAQRIACRLGGDEFLLFIGGVRDDEHASELAEAISISLSGIYSLTGEQVRVSCSIGLATLPNKEFNIDRAILSADLALYTAKSLGKGRWCKFEQSMDDQYVRRQQLKLALARAIEANMLSVIYQPLVDAKTGRMVSCEALSRWYDPNFGHVSPSEYIPLAEEMGLVSKITAQTLKKATAECAKWPEHISVSVNLSQNDFRSGDIFDVIKSTLADANLPPHRLEVEVTETAVSSDENKMIEKLQYIHEMGVKIALDDFGTGQSSLSYLHRLPLDKVKIDQSFVSEIDKGETALGLLHGVTELCSTLGLDVTVEGVETIAQLELVVARANVDRIQGYIYGPGLPASGIASLAGLSSLPLQQEDKVSV